MTARELFSKVRNDQREIDSLRRRLDSAKDLSIRCTQNLSPAPAKTNVVDSQVANLVAAIVDLETSLRKQLSDSVKDRVIASIAINALKDPDQRMVCEMRVLSGYSFDRIAEETGYAQSWAYELYKKACKETDGYLKDKKYYINTANTE